MRIRAASVVGSGASLVAGVAVPIAFPNTDPWVGYALLAVAAALGFIALWLYWPHRKGGGEGGIAVSTSGPHSPAFGPVGRDVHIHNHAPPAATQPRKQVHYRGWNQRSLDGLARVMRGHNRLERQDRRKRDEEIRCPEMPIWKAIDHVRRMIGDDDSGQSYPEARKRIRQAALEEELVVWGRKEIPPAHLQAEQKASTVWSKIDPYYWHEYELNRLSTVDRFDDRDHTQSESFAQKIGERYWSLRVREKAVKRLWREPPRATDETDDDGDSWKTV